MHILIRYYGRKKDKAMKVYGYANNLKGEQIYGRLVDRKFLLVKDSTLIEIKPDTFQSEQEIRVKEKIN